MKTATTTKELYNLVCDMLEIEHPHLLIHDMRPAEDGQLIIPVSLPEQSPAFEWTHPAEEWRTISVYLCRKSSLILKNVEEFGTSRDYPKQGNPRLEDICFDGRTVSIYSGSEWGFVLIWATVSDLSVVLEVGDEVVDILTIYQCDPEGVERLSYGIDGLQRAADDAGLDWQTVDQQVLWRS